MQMGARDPISGRMDRMRKGNKVQIPLPYAESSVCLLEYICHL